jgi:hypothetical protein
VQAYCFSIQQVQFVSIQYCVQNVTSKKLWAKMLAISSHTAGYSAECGKMPQSLKPRKTKLHSELGA